MEIDLTKPIDEKDIKEIRKFEEDDEPCARIELVSGTVIYMSKKLLCKRCQLEGINTCPHEFGEAEDMDNVEFLSYTTKDDMTFATCSRFVDKEA